MTTADWDTSLYENKHNFVWEYGKNLIDMLSPQRGERILDLGCGTGQLTAKIGESGAAVVGLDSSSTMIDKAKTHYPHLDFRVGNGEDFQFDTRFDAVFSNASLHWMKRADRVLQCSHACLNRNARFIAEFGGKGNVSTFITSLDETMLELGYAVESLSPWFFPSIGEYTLLMEQYGFQVSLAELYQRPTPLESGERGFHDWVRMFGTSWLKSIPDSNIDNFLDRCASKIRDRAFTGSHWIADYCRLRIYAIKIGDVP